MRSEHLKTHHWQYLNFVILTWGILSRLAVYFQNRSLFIDEANLAQNIAGRNFLELLAPLDPEQYAPPLFLWITESITLVFGINEFSLRAFPLFCGILALIVFYKLGKQFFSEAELAFPLALLAFSPIFVRYAVEFKQYSPDMLVALLIVYFALKFPVGQAKNCLWVGLGSLCILLSMPAVFVLAGAGFYGLLHLKIKNKGKLRESLPLGISGERGQNFPLLPWFLVTGCWLAVFVLYYLFIIRDGIGRNTLETFHAPYFLPFFPTSITDLDTWGNLLLSMLRSAVGYTVLGIVCGIVFYMVGIYRLYKDQRGVLLLLFLPIILCFVASGLQLYSLIPRLTLFFLPLVLITIGVGTTFFFSKKSKWLNALIGVALFIIVINKDGWQSPWTKMQYDDFRLILDDVKSKKLKADMVYIHHSARPAFIFYTKNYDSPYQIPGELILSEWNDSPDKVYKHSKNKNPTMLLLFAYGTKPDERKCQGRMANVADLKSQFVLEGGAWYFYENN